MSQFIHQIFYGNKKFDITEESISALEQWAIPSAPAVAPAIDLPPSPRGRESSFLSPRVHSPVVLSPVVPSPMVLSPVVLSPIPKREKIHHPTAFWCLFIAKYGYIEYLQVGNRQTNRELEEKQKMVEMFTPVLSSNAKKSAPGIRKNLKDGNMRLTNDAVQEILSSLMVSSKEELYLLVAYSQYYEKTVYVEFDHSYFVFSPSASSLAEGGEDTILLRQVRRSLGKTQSPPFYEMETDVAPEQIAELKRTKVALEQYAKPFRGVSAYTRGELEEFARKADVLGSLPPKYTKATLYEKVAEKCCDAFRR